MHNATHRHTTHTNRPYPPPPLLPPTLKNIINRRRRSYEIALLHKQNHCADAHCDQQQHAENRIAELGLLLHWHRAFVRRAGHMAGALAIDRCPIVVQRGRLQDDAGRAGQHGQREDPQEQPVEHHGDVLPVLLHLGGVVLHFRVLRNEAHTEAAPVHGRRTAVMRVRRILVDGTLAAVAADQHVLVVRMLLLLLLRLQWHRGTDDIGADRGGIRQLRHVRCVGGDVAVDLATAAECAAQSAVQSAAGQRARGMK